MARDKIQLAADLLVAFNEVPKDTADAGMEDWAPDVDPTSPTFSQQIDTSTGLPVSPEQMDQVGTDTMQAMIDAIATAIDDYIANIEVTMDNVTATFDSDIELPLHTGEFLGDSLVTYIASEGSVAQGIATWLRAVIGPGWASKDADIDLPLEGTGKLE